MYKDCYPLSISHTDAFHADVLEQYSKANTGLTEVRQRVEGKKRAFYCVNVMDNVLVSDFKSDTDADHVYWRSQNRIDSTNKHRKRNKHSGSDNDNFVVCPSRELSEECNGLRGGVSPVPPASARSNLPNLPAHSLQPITTMGDGLEAGSSQNPPSAPPHLSINPPPPETWNPTKPKRQTNQLQVQRSLCVWIWALSGVWAWICLIVFFPLSVPA